MSVSPNSAFSKADKEAVRAATHAAVKRGELEAPASCSACGQGGLLDIHHRDYAEPLDVVWLCPPCHSAEHARFRATVRKAKAQEAQRLKAEGLNGVQIAAHMGVSRAYAYELLADPDGSEARARKDRLRGRVCENCGALLNISSKRWCLSCVRGGVLATWTRETITEAFRAFHEEVGRPPRSTDLNPGLAEHLSLSDAAERRERYERMRLPDATTVQKVFGSFNAGVIAAGYQPFHPVRDRDWGPWRPRNAA